MQIQYKILEKLVSLTNREMDFFLYIARYQNEDGMVEGVYYKDICKEVGMCKQTFYNTLQSLQEKGIVEYCKRTESDYDICICGNKLYDKKNPEGYINLNRKIFRDKRFKNMRAKEKIMLLEFMKITHSNRGIYIIAVQKFYEKYERLFGISKRVIRCYLQTLRRYFSIHISAGKYYISYQAEKFQELQVSGLRQRREYLAKIVCRRGGVKQPTKEDIKNVADMIQQSMPIAVKKGMDLLRIMQLSIEKCVREQIVPVLKPKRVHMILNECLV